MLVGVVLPLTVLRMTVVSLYKHKETSPSSSIQQLTCMRDATVQIDFARSVQYRISQGATNHSTEE